MTVSAIHIKYCKLFFNSLIDVLNAVPDCACVLKMFFEWSVVKHFIPLAPTVGRQVAARARVPVILSLLSTYNLMLFI